MPSDAAKVLRRQLKQALDDKVVLVKALHQLTAQMARARAEVKQHAAASERSLSTAWRLGQLGQLGLALLEANDEDGAAELAPSVAAPVAALDDLLSVPASSRTTTGPPSAVGMDGELLREAAYHAGLAEELAESPSFATLAGMPPSRNASRPPEPVDLHSLH